MTPKPIGKNTMYLFVLCFATVAMFLFVNPMTAKELALIVIGFVGRHISGDTQ